MEGAVKEAERKESRADKKFYSLRESGTRVNWQIKHGRVRPGV